MAYQLKNNNYHKNIFKNTRENRNADLNIPWLVLLQK